MTGVQPEQILRVNLLVAVKCLVTQHSCAAKARRTANSGEMGLFDTQTSFELTMLYTGSAGNVSIT